MLWGLELRDPSEVARLEERLTTAGFPTIDISGIEAAQVQLALQTAHDETAPRTPCSEHIIWYIFGHLK